MAFKGLVITDAGRALIASTQNSHSLCFDSVAVGDGEQIGEITSTTQMANKLFSVLPSMKRQNDDEVFLEVDMSSNNFSEGYYFREIGVYALDENENRILYAYDNAGVDAEYINSNDSPISHEKRLRFIFKVSNEVDVQIKTPGGLYALKDELKDVAFSGDIKDLTGWTDEKQHIDQALATKAEKSMVEQLSNPNLLINGDFKIWQRGIIMTPKTNNSYVADRWKAGGASANNLKFEKVVNGIKITNMTASTRIFSLEQIFEHDYNFIKSVQQRGVSISFEIEGLSECRYASNFQQYDTEGTFIRSTSTIDGTAKSNEIVSFVMGKDLHADYNFGLSISLYLEANSSIRIHFVKMELGNIATPLFSRSDAEELATCKRYYETLHVDSDRHYNFTETTGYILTKFSLTQKRVTPSFMIFDMAGNAGYCSRMKISTGYTHKQAVRVSAFDDGVTFDLISDPGVTAYAITAKVIADAEFY